MEVFCAPQHFSYRDSQAIRELGDALGEHRLRLHSVHAPTERDLAPGRESGVPISISDPERIRRLDAVDEIKRALDVAERIPFQYSSPAYRAWPADGGPAKAGRGVYFA